LLYQNSKRQNQGQEEAKDYVSHHDNFSREAFCVCGSIPSQNTAKVLGIGHCTGHNCVTIRALDVIAVRTYIVHFLRVIALSSSVSSEWYINFTVDGS
jgi:hypothetical protein